MQLTARPAMAGRKVSMRARAAAPARRSVTTKAFSDVNVTVTVCNAAMLALGRFAFMPYQRAQIAKAGLPTQNGTTHEASGDIYAKEASFITSTNDPSGFTLIDVMGWGSLGHALAYAVLATSTNGYDRFLQ